MAAKSVLTEFYNKGEVIAKDVDPKEDFKDLPSDPIIVRVKHGSKVRNIMGFVEKSLKDEATKCMIFCGCGDAIEKTITCVEIAKTKFKDEATKCMIFCGCGDAIEKTITCVEIAKTKFKELHQITKLNTFRVEEYWEPTKPDLDRLQVTREIPMVSILLSKHALDSSEPGYQEPGNPIKVKKPFKRRKTPVKDPSTSKSTDDSPME